MEINGLKADIHMPTAPQGEGFVHQLPPACQQHPLLVDEYPACPSNWMNGSDIASSYFMPLVPGKHMWLDFNANAFHQHDVAVVLSVQGINPITGQQTKQLRLEQYRTNCPVHDVPFKQDRFCETCNYKWPAQNYMTTTSTPTGLFWIDGFRAQDGQVRGFLVTEEAVRGVASQLIGEERVFAIGVAFYLSKTAKPVQQYVSPQADYNLSSFGSPKKKSGPGGSGILGKKYVYDPPTSWNECIGSGGGDVWMASSTNTFGGSGGGETKSAGSLSCESLNNAGCYGSNNAAGVGGASAGGGSNSAMSMPRSRGMLRSASFNAAAPDSVAADSFSFTEDVQQVEPTKLEIAAGAVIQQELCYMDHNELSYWNDKPVGMLYLNYCTKADFEKIKKAGKRQMSGSFLAGLAVGN